DAVELGAKLGAGGVGVLQFLGVLGGVGAGGGGVGLGAGAFGVGVGLNFGGFGLGLRLGLSARGRGLHRRELVAGLVLGEVGVALALGGLLAQGGEAGLLGTFDGLPS